MNMPYAMIFGPADVSHMMKDMQRLYDIHPQVRTRFGQVASSAGIDVDVILRKTPLLDGRFMHASGFARAACRHAGHRRWHY
ncbi:Uncharacterised protein [Serratia fonticola]|uniref:Uncharacterized protein n=1 Tax=Serratia fonticola TaxID=47917 RepID=A0A4U9WJ81_SERFO|nr:Uncharacterised protein [Serratia fonticola]